MNPFSVCLSVYNKDNAEHFRIAVESIFNQSIPPNEVIVVVDGPVTTTIEAVINLLQKSHENLRIIRLKINQGLARARQLGIENTKYDIIALMDSDDISSPDRFEKQLQCFSKDETLSVIGGQIHEFIDTPDKVVGIRNVPLEHSEINLFLKKRCPFNHMTVMLKKSELVKVGGYKDWYFNEDYFLWLRMYKAGCKFKNLPDSLVNVRVGKEMYSRRGGWKYFISEAKLQTYMIKQHIINFPTYLINLIIRFVIQLLMPNWLRGFVFRKLLRKRIN